MRDHGLAFGRAIGIHKDAIRATANDTGGNPFAVFN
jgi:hypothetical protein